MKRVSLFIMILILILPSAFSAGGGGGGSSSTPSCSQDTWECSEWSVCNIDSLSSRTCEMTFDCSETETPKPSESEDCKYVSQMVKKLKCGNLISMKERVTCRLSLTSTEQQEELAVQYLPEECRAFSSDTEKERCIGQYNKVQSCWQIPPGDDRIDCVKQKLDMRELRLEKAQCENKSSNEKANCLHALKEKSYAVIKFRLYDLEERAEMFLEKGADNNLVTNFIANIEGKKVEFNNAETTAERKQILLDTKSLWKQFIQDIKAGKKA